MNKEQISIILKKIKIIEEKVNKKQIKDKVLVDKKFILNLVEILQKILIFLQKNDNKKK
jgi:hypothetical protein|tara:strand:+ start:10 stop:186 length:177 start_codon:yes stop_codon:yes gene_type:complete